ncbi:MAG: glycoside hydrolase family 2 protein [Oscillospiraceae bacterium]|jgi:beta-mannosidase|nr:glycoside hydrolase family 2 protein [Oscillospiraceae bacterium]
MTAISLNGPWQFRLRGQAEAMPAVVPGCNTHDLLRLGRVEDPFYGENEPKAAWIEDTDFDYFRSFTLSPDLLDSAARILLRCDMLDTLCRVYLNDHLVGEGKNSFICYRFDVTDAVVAGENTLRVEFDAPAPYIRARNSADKMPPNPMGIRGMAHLRKAQCHFGWDWGPRIPVSGITGDIALECYEAARLLPPRIVQRHAQGLVTLEAQAFFEQYAPGDVAFRLRLFSPGGDCLAESDTPQLTAEIANPQLWWTHDLGEQPLYAIQIEILRGGAPIDTLTRRIGLRTLELNREADEYGHNFQFVLNGTAVFAKGGNYIPPDSFPDRAPEKKRPLLENCVRANMNCVRIWGGGFYETDAFYDACDELGLLVWQDFAFACSPYPFYREEFLENVKAEVIDNVCRLRHHASLALWSGNNEIEQMSPLWKNRRELTRWTERFFYHILPELVREHDGQTPFTHGSPSGEAYMKHVGGDQEGDTHLWQVWHGLMPLTFYRTRFTRFCSEFGLESLPTMQTVETFAEPKDYSLTGSVFNAHQKSPSGNRKMLFYIATKYLIPKGFRDLLYLTQLIQAEGVRDATEHWRRQRGRCNGSLYWQLNDCWPVCSWAGIDYLGRNKAVQYASRHFNAPVCVSVEDTPEEMRLYVLNDTRTERALALRWRLLDFDGRELQRGEKAFNAPAVSSSLAETLSVKQLCGKEAKTKLFLRAELLEEGRVISARTQLFCAEKDAALPLAKLRAQVKVEADTAYITVSSNKFARQVLADSEWITGNMSDNFVDILPNEPVTLTAPAGGRTAQELQASLRFTCVNNITNTHSAAYGAALRARIQLIPVNLAAGLIYRLGIG